MVVVTHWAQEFRPRPNWEIAWPGADTRSLRRTNTNIRRMQYLEHDRHGHSGDIGVPAAILATDVAKGVTGSLAEVDTGYHVWGEGAPW